VKLTRRGRQFLGLCPFHGEKTPSFHVYDDHYHCFGCGAHGSVIDFVMQAEKVGFTEAVERLAAQAGMVLPSASREDMERERRRGSLYDVLEAATVYYHKLLRMPEGKSALDYLRRRGVGDAAIERFRLGYAPEGRYAVKAALVREGFADEAMIEAGLLVQPKDGTGGAYDRFRERVMFPIADQRGRVVGFGGRMLGTGEPKYLNSPETPLFRKGRLLYNLADGSKAARDKGTIIVVEGYMDVIALAEAGWENVVAPLGTAITEDQLQVLWRLVPEPILLFDPDAAGERAAVRAAERALPLIKAGVALRFAFLITEPGDDPDTVARKYRKQVIHRTLVEAVPLSELFVLMETRRRRFTAPEHWAALRQRLGEHAARISDSTARSQIQREFKDRVWQAYRRARRSEKEARGALRNSQAQNAALSPEKEPDSLAEKTLLAIVINHPDFFHEVEDELGALTFADPALDHLRQGLVQLLSGRTAADVAGILAALAARGLGEAAVSLLDDPLIRSHRRIVHGAPLAEVRETWVQNAALARQLANLADAPSPRDRGAGALARLAHRRAALGHGTD
jgi:DNA primase